MSLPYIVSLGRNHEIILAQRDCRVSRQQGIFTALLSDVVKVTLSQGGRHSRNKKTKKQLAFTLLRQSSIISTNSCEGRRLHSDVVKLLNMLGCSYLPVLSKTGTSLYDKVT
jgi:hypothetical protein